MLSVDRFYFVESKIHRFEHLQNLITPRQPKADNAPVANSESTFEAA